MDSPEVTFTLAYVVFAVCFVFTPTEFHSAGLTVQNLLSGWLGSEDAAFVPYHLRRTAATVLCHSLLPLGELGGRGRRSRPSSGTPEWGGTAEGARAGEPGLRAKRPCAPRSGENGAGGSCLLQVPGGKAGSILGEGMLCSLGRVVSCHVGGRASSQERGVS